MKHDFCFQSMVIMNRGRDASNVGHQGGFAPNIQITVAMADRRKKHDLTMDGRAIHNREFRKSKTSDSDHLTTGPKHICRWCHKAYKSFYVLAPHLLTCKKKPKKPKKNTRKIEDRPSEYEEEEESENSEEEEERNGDSESQEKEEIENTEEKGEWTGEYEEIAEIENSEEEEE